jgi:hypothetical protein
VYPALRRSTYIEELARLLRRPPLGNPVNKGFSWMLEVSFSSLRWLYQPSLDESRTHTLVVPRQLPARPRFHQVLKERYLFVLGDLAFFVSNELVHQSHETHLRIFGDLRILGAADVL